MRKVIFEIKTVGDAVPSGTSSSSVTSGPTAEIEAPTVIEALVVVEALETTGRITNELNEVLAE